MFAVLITEDGFEEVTVEYRRYWCKNCGKPTPPDIRNVLLDSNSAQSHASHEAIALTGDLE